MHQTHQMTLPRPSGGANREGGREKSPEVQRFNRYPETKTLPYEEDDYRQSKTSLREETHKYLEQPVTKYTNNKFIERQKSFENKKVFQRQKSFGELELKSRVSKSLDKEKYFDSLPDKYYYQSGCNQFDREDKFDDYCEEDVLDRYNEKKYISRNDRDKNGKYYEDDGFDENIKYRNKPVDYEKKSPSQRYPYDDAEYFGEYRGEETSRPVPKIRQKYPSDHYNDQGGYDSQVKSGRPKSSDARYYDDQEPVKPRSVSNDYDRSEIREERSKRPQELFDSNSMGMRNGRYRQRSPDSHLDEVKAPRDRFKDAKEKFLLMERERLEKERNLKRPESPISPVRRYDNHSRTSYDDRYYDSRRDREHQEEVQLRPKPAPRQRVEAEELPPVRYRERNSREREAPVERYRHTDKLDPKRRSMYSLIEEERRKNSSEIAKELKRRSYMEGCTFEEDPRSAYPRGHYQDMPDSSGYPDSYSRSGVESERSDNKFTKNQKVTKNSAGYRHSYAEPKMRTDKNGAKKHFAEVLHRTNSTAGNGRVGIASLHHY
ncbi:unnamed protein product [Acanthoscelides obtectus]|uniref:Uncharacterized protein n=1 Tax=Acanthoscelides obtectus TaxID=200917 RepID=A0A9P0NUD1_ACAOB|nr:unnamed protein product [Acanthoscelides obtectus]CAK1639885.1 hypothetical protein AOBTE_LOCUS11430 [Acanthoscelides obtectus]